MMNEIIFVVETVEITDCDTDVSRIAKVITDTKETYSYEDLEEIVDKLNEQQATINELQAQLREKEQDEKLYANEILELRETNKEWLQFKSLGGDY